jgi:hypothetical protein
MKVFCIFYGYSVGAFAYYLSVVKCIVHAHPNYPVNPRTHNLEVIHDWMDTGNRSQVETTKLRCKLACQMHHRIILLVKYSFADFRVALRWLEWSRRVRM